MPHVIIDHSAGLEQTHDMQALCQAIYDTLAAHPAIPNPTSLKIRIRAHDTYVIGTRPGSFAHAELRLLPGRDDATKTALTALVLDQMAQALPSAGSLTVEACEMHGPSYAKRLL